MLDGLCKIPSLDRPEIRNTLPNVLNKNQRLVLLYLNLVYVILIFLILIKYLFFLKNLRYCKIILLCDMLTLHENVYSYIGVLQKKYLLHLLKNTPMFLIPS